MYSKLLRALSLLIAVIMLSFTAVSCNFDLSATLNGGATEKTSDEAKNSLSGSNTEKPTELETEKPTEKPTEEPTEAPTEEPSEAPTEEPSEEPTEEPSESEKVTDDYGDIPFEPVLPDLDFEGENLVVLIREDKKAYREWYKESPEDELDEAVALRNKDVGDALNIEVDYQLIPFYGYDDFVTNFNYMMLDDVLCDWHYIDIGANYSYGAAYHEVRDIASNLNDREMFPYFDFSLPCWNQSIVNNTTINDRLHYIAGDMNLSVFDNAMVMWVNKSLYDNKKEPTDPQNIQEYALAGAWTYDDLYTWASRLYEDSNGIKDKQADDTYGLCIKNGDRWGPNPTDAIPYAWDLEFVVTNSDGTHSFNIIGNERAEKALVKYKELIFANGSCINSATGCENFAAGNYVFWADLIYPDEDDNMAIREMEDKYSILPWPKYESNQENYRTTAQEGYTLMTVLDHSESSIPTKGEAVSAYLQLSCEESYTYVRGYYFNRIVKPKYFGTDDSEGFVTNSIALFVTIIDNIEFEFWTIYSRQLNNVVWLWRDAVDPETTLEGEYLKEQSRFEQAIEDTDIWLFSRGSVNPW